MTRIDRQERTDQSIDADYCCNQRRERNDTNGTIRRIDRLLDGFSDGRVADRRGMLVQGSSGFCCAAEPVAVCVASE